MDLAEQIAAKAQKTHEDHCAKAAGAGAESDAALATAEVGAVWAEVALVHETTGATWLLYWRGLLAQCIGQNERAAEALEEFVESGAALDGMDAMVRDAEKRLRRLRPEYDAPERARRPPTPEQRRRAGQLAAGLVLAFGAGGAGAGSAAGFSGLASTHSTLMSLTRSASAAEGLLDQGDHQLAAGVGLAAGATVAAVISIASFVGAGRPSQVGVVLLPTPIVGGMALSAGGRW